MFYNYISLRDLDHALFEKKSFMCYKVYIKYQGPYICDSRLLTFSHYDVPLKKKNGKEMSTQIGFSSAVFGSSILTFSREL